jgi:hypothetical protein
MGGYDTTSTIVDGFQPYARASLGDCRVDGCQIAVGVLVSETLESVGYCKAGPLGESG